MITKAFSTRSAAGVAAIILCAGAALGNPEPLAAPAGEVILEISGAIDVADAEGRAAFDLAMLQALERAEVSTTTIWTTGEQHFAGVPLAALIARVGGRGTQIEAIALNDYRVTLPMTDLVPGGPIVAYESNGKTLSVREKGPLWIIYPFDQNPAYRSETYFARSVWQLSKIVVLP